MCLRPLQNVLPIVVLLSALVNGAWGHETDQFAMPVGEEFADLGPEWNEFLYETVREGVEQTNRDIRRTVEGGNVYDGFLPSLRPRGGQGPRRMRSSVTLEELRSPREITSRVAGAFPSGAFLIEHWERKVHTDEMQDAYPGMIVGYKPPFRETTFGMVHWVIDPRLLFRIFRASTIKMHDTYLGVDKTGHFTDIGYWYYKAYRQALNEGKSKEQAREEAVRTGAEGILSESAFLGYVTAGAFSNADMASNYLGMKFYINLTEPTMIKGRVREPMLVLEDGLWKIQPHVTPEYFSIFISDHLNEALNPSLFGAGMRDAVREAVREQCESILEWYAQDDQNKRTREYFDQVLHELTTYYGEDYGHRGDPSELISIGNTCFGEASH